MCVACWDAGTCEIVGAAHLLQVGALAQNPICDYRGWRRARVVAWLLAGLNVLALVAALVLVVLNAGRVGAGRVGLDVLLAVAVLVYAGTGRLIASRLPGNAIGWLLCLIGLSLASCMLTEQFAVYGLATAPGSLPAARLAGWLSATLAAAAVVLLLVLILLFPDGRLPSRRWRPVLWAIAVVAVGWLAAQLRAGTTISGGITNAVQAAGATYANPLGILPRHGWFSALIGVSFVLALITGALVLSSVFVRRRGAGTEVRQQLAWLGYVGVMTALWVAVLAGAILIMPSGNSWLGTLIWSFLILTPVVGIPLACAVAVLRYRLYDLDVVVKKTVIAGVVAAAFTAIYALVVVALGAMTGHAGSSALTFAAAALAAVALQPVRARAGLLADRLVYGRRASPYEVLSEFAGQIAGTYSTEEVLPAMARMVAEATGAERVGVWLASGGAERLETAWPATAEPPDAPAAAEPEGRTRSFAVQHRGELLGALRVTSSPREPLTPAGERLVSDVAAQAGLVLRNVALIDDLRASRQRIVTAADQARRALERDLHDGAQQQLVALKISLGLARQVIAAASDDTAELLAQAEHQAEEALKDLRELARGIYPPLLADHGLSAALEAQARKAAVAVTIETSGIGRYPQDVEAAVYFCVLEGLQNVAKYARAPAARVTLCQDSQYLTFTVADDGKGFDPATTPIGTGLQGITDRLAAVGGVTDIASAPGHGTRITGQVPAARGGASQRSDRPAQLVPASRMQNEAAVSQVTGA
jgi:signal transduction histidine kinase